MSLPPAPAPFTDADYEMIAAAVEETARGRWFLAEHARRNRHADTRLVLEAIEKLERSMNQRASGTDGDRLRGDLAAMMNAITRTKNEIAAIKPVNGRGRIGEATNELDAIVEATEKATSDILAAAERVQEIASKLREGGTDGLVCDLIDSNAAEIYTACSFQDLTGQRIHKIVRVLRFLEERIESMIRIWRIDDLAFAPSAPAEMTSAGKLPDSGSGLQQQAIDELLGVERKADVFWRDARIQEGHDPRNLGEFDLDDLVVFETSPDAQPGLDDGNPHTAPGTAPIVANGHDKPSEPNNAGSSPNREDFESLTIAERFALYS